jgi:hypothetical protein
MTRGCLGSRVEGERGQTVTVTVTVIANLVYVQDMRAIKKISMRAKPDGEGIDYLLGVLRRGQS